MAIKKFLLNKKEYSLEIKKQNNKIFEITINEKTANVTMPTKNTSQNKLYLKIDGSCYKANIVTQTHKQITLYIENFQKHFTIDLTQKKIIPAKLIKSQTPKKSPKKITSPLAGKVIKVNVQPNQFVTKNQTLVIIESMKMENEIRATNDSFIKNVLIKESDLVQQNQLLITFDKRRDTHVESKNPNEQKTI